MSVTVGFIGKVARSGDRRNSARTSRSETILKVHGLVAPVASQSPCQPTNTLPDAALACRPTSDAAVKLWSQVVPQLMLEPITLVTDPLPSPCSITLSWPAACAPP